MSDEKREQQKEYETAMKHMIMDSNLDPLAKDVICSMFDKLHAGLILLGNLNERVTKLENDNSDEETQKLR